MMASIYLALSGVFVFEIKIDFSNRHPFVG